MKKFNLINVKMWKARNGAGLSCILTIDDKPVCDFYDKGDGSRPDVEILDKNLYSELSTAIEEMPAMYVEQYGTELKIDLCMFIDLLNYALETKTEFNLLAA